MKKILSLTFLLLLACSQVFAASQWELDNVTGATDPTDLDTVIQQNNDALDRLDRNYRQGCQVVPDTAAQVTIKAPCEIMICNSGGTDCEMRGATSDVTVSWADIDTGSEATSTDYRVFVTADTDITNFVEQISTSSAPSGATQYREIGYFYNNASGDIEAVGNKPSAGIVNFVNIANATQRSTTSSSYTDIGNTTLNFRSYGGNVYAIGCGAFTGSGNASLGLKLYLDSDISASEGGAGIDAGASGGSGGHGDYACTVPYRVVLSAGTHQAKMKWKYSSFTGYAERTNVMVWEEL